jgi:hypothetical protein
MTPSVAVTTCVPAAVILAGAAQVSLDLTLDHTKHNKISYVENEPPPSSRRGVLGTAATPSTHPILPVPLVSLPGWNFHSRCAALVAWLRQRCRCGGRRFWDYVPIVSGIHPITSGLACTDAPPQAPRARLNSDPQIPQRSLFFVHFHSPLRIPLIAGCRAYSCQ